MDLYITNPKFELVGVIDSYTSLIWTERYNDCGDFEIYRMDIISKEQIQTE